MGGTLFEQTFHVDDINPDGKKFDRVTRIICTSTNDIEMILDVNSELFPVSKQERLSCKLVGSLNANGEPDSETYSSQHQQSPLLDQCDYAMRGKIFRIEPLENKPTQISIYTSFGGLLMRLSGEQRHFAEMNIDARLYLLMSKK